MLHLAKSKMPCRSIDAPHSTIIKNNDRRPELFSLHSNLRWLSNRRDVIIEPHRACLARFGNANRMRPLT